MEVGRNNKISRNQSQNRGGGGGARRGKRVRNGEAFGFTSTLLEAQEFGELMENEDEVNFALDGLRKGNQIRTQRASLVSLLAICTSQHQRRSLRAQGYHGETITVTRYNNGSVQLLVGGMSYQIIFPYNEQNGTDFTSRGKTTMREYCAFHINN